MTTLPFVGFMQMPQSIFVVCWHESQGEYRRDCLSQCKVNYWISNRGWWWTQKKKEWKIPFMKLCRHLASFDHVCTKFKRWKLLPGQLLDRIFCDKRQATMAEIIFTFNAGMRLMSTSAIEHSLVYMVDRSRSSH